MVTHDGAPQTWIRKNIDTDGYFLLELVNSKELEQKFRYRTPEFLTAGNPSSLTIQGTCTVVYVKKGLFLIQMGI